MIQSEKNYLVCGLDGIGVAPQTPADNEAYQRGINLRALEKGEAKPDTDLTFCRELVVVQKVKDLVCTLPEESARVVFRAVEDLVAIHFEDKEDEG